MERSTSSRRIDYASVYDETSACEERCAAIRCVDQRSYADAVEHACGLVQRAGARRRWSEIGWGGRAALPCAWRFVYNWRKRKPRAALAKPACRAFARAGPGDRAAADY